ncbi:MAG: PAS domain-containing protein, partial [Burkholderiaceae bacterium]|nr:PAS domain-containing protein [Burkholderiaceae bacterium]
MTTAASDPGLSDSAPLAALRARLESQVEQLRRREQSLLAAQAEFSALLENNVAAVATLRDGVILRANPLMQALLGSDEAALIGRHIGSVFVEADTGAVELLDAIASREPRARTTRVQLLRGGVEAVSCLLYHGPYPVRGAGYASLVVAVDGSGQQATEVALENSQERFGRFADALDEALLVFDANSGTALFANDRIVDVLGAEVGAFYGDPRAAWRSVDPQDLAALETCFAAALESGPQELDLRIVHPGPSVGVVRLRIIPARAGSGELYCLAEDVTEVRSLAQSRLDEAIA